MSDYGKAWEKRQYFKNRIDNFKLDKSNLQTLKEYLRKLDYLVRSLEEEEEYLRNFKED